MLRRVNWAWRAVAGVALLTLLAWYAGPQSLWRQLRGAEPVYVGLAIVVGLLGNLLTAARWASIARRLGLHARLQSMIVLYARSMAANCFLPGAPVAGDMLRVWQLSRLGNGLKLSTLSVFLDRASGLWMLCLLSLAGLLWTLASQNSTAGPGLLGTSDAAAYLAALVVAVSLPFLPAGFRHPFFARAREARSAVLGSAGYSVGVQLLAIIALWLCAKSVAMAVAFPSAIAAAATVFVIAALPVGVAGFGGREMGAILAFGALGVPREQAMAASLLYGVTTLIQGMVAASAYLARPR